MESKGKCNDVVTKTIQDSADETINGNASTLEEGDGKRAKPKPGAIASTENSIKETPPCGSDKNEIGLEKKIGQKAFVSRDEKKTSAAAQQPPSSIPCNSNKISQDSKNKPELTQRDFQEPKQQQQCSTGPSSQRQGQPQNPTRKRARQQLSPLQTLPEKSQNLTRNKIDEGNLSDFWTRYDLTKTELTTPHETAELKAVRKQIWKRKKFVPYTGINSLHSSYHNK